MEIRLESDRGHRASAIVGIEDWDAILTCIEQDFGAEIIEGLRENKSQKMFESIYSDSLKGNNDGKR